MGEQCRVVTARRRERLKIADVVEKVNKINCGAVQKDKLFFIQYKLNDLFT